MDGINFKLNLSFDGSSYSGWQRQKNAVSIQCEVEKALAGVLGIRTCVNGVGRTDARAHAVNYTANFLAPGFPIPASKLRLILNRRLPGDIRVNSIEEAPPGFHSRFSAYAREYVYIILEQPRVDPLTLPYLPFLSRYTYSVEDPIDILRLKEVCRLFRGNHSFRNFCYGYKKKIDFTRLIYYLRVKRCGPLTLFFIKGNGFLNGMIRSIVSVCLNYSRGKIDSDLVIDSLADRTDLLPLYKTPVPARGLIFKRGYYSPADKLDDHEENGS